MPSFRSRYRNTPTWLLLAVVGLLAMGVNAALVALAPPTPRVHDEFSYLLLADTFASGRLTNPTHAHWPHFETMHVIQQPSYASKYPPGQGLLLAAGRMTLGTELAGVCCSTGIAAMACSWMLLAFVPRRWALLGGALIAMHSGIQLQWGMSYWGGALAMTGGALVVGAAGRLWKGCLRPSPAAGFAIGAVLLAITRPFEGFVLTAGAAIVILVAVLRQSDVDGRGFARMVLAPTLSIGFVGLAALLTYNNAVTGSPWKMPYQIHEASYGATPLFLWQQPKIDQEYRNDVLRRYHLGASMWWYDQQQTWDGLLTLKGWLSRCSLEFFLATPVSIALLATGWIRRRSLWPWLCLGGVTWLAACLTVWMFPHYLAPIAPLLLLMLIAGLRSFHAIERRLPRGRRWLTPALVGLQALLFVAEARQKILQPQVSWAHGRQQFAAGLLATPGDDLVFVRYSPKHNVHNEWVYNRADIDGSPIVWARELGAQADQQLRHYYSDRRVWLLLADEQPLQLLPYHGNEKLADSGRPTN